jgi:hypothetical protein
MLRNVADPFNAGLFELGVGIEAAGDGAVDEDGFLLVEEFDLALLLGNQGVDLGRFPVEEGDDAVLLLARRTRELEPKERMRIKSQAAGGDAC